MAGINHSGQRPKTTVKGGLKTKRFRNDNEKQAAYHAKIAARRLKRKIKKGR